jgi:phosphoglycerate kinase
MSKMTVKDIDVTGKRVLVRVDFNVPTNPKTGDITDDSRIRASMPTIDYLLEHNAKVILMSHLGRPDGKVAEEFRLNKVADRLSRITGQKVIQTSDCVGSEVEAAVAAMKTRQIVLLENLRFHAEEETGDPAFAKSLAKLGDIYVNDAFGTAHRPHASITGVAAILPAVAGFLMEKEITFLGHALEHPERPFGALIGGAKISDKVKMLDRMMSKVDYLMIGGGMAATFLKARGLEIGKSKLEDDRIQTATMLMDRASHNHVQLLLPIDVVVSHVIDNGSQIETVDIKSIPSDERIVDIGPKTIAAFSAALEKCKTAFWNGPMGIYEIPEFAAGTKAMAKTLVSLKGTTIIGGGSTAEAVTEMGLADKMTFVSTGGGASLSFVSGEKLPGVEALMDKK